MLLADLGQVISFLVFLVWIIFSIRESQRKKRLKEMRRRAAQEQQRQRQESDGEHAPKESKLEPRQQSEGALRRRAQQKRRADTDQAEKAAKEADYQAAPRGPNLEIRVEDILKGLEPPGIEQLEELEEKIEQLEQKNQRLLALVNHLRDENKRNKAALISESSRPSYHASMESSLRAQKQATKQLDPYAFPLRSRLKRGLSKERLATSIVLGEILKGPKAPQPWRRSR